MAGGVAGSARELTIVCTLSGAEQTDRRQEATRKLFAGCWRVGELEDGYVFEFPGDNDRVEALTRFIMAERECCTFFTFELTFEPGRGPVHLRMRGPRDTKEFIRRRSGIEEAGSLPHSRPRPSRQSTKPGRPSRRTTSAPKGSRPTPSKTPSSDPRTGTPTGQTNPERKERS